MFSSSYKINLQLLITLKAFPFYPSSFNGPLFVKNFT